MQYDAAGAGARFAVDSKGVATDLSLPPEAADLGATAHPRVNLPDELRPPTDTVAHTGDPLEPPPDYGSQFPQNKWGPVLNFVARMLGKPWDHGNGW